MTGGGDFFFFFFFLAARAGSQIKNAKNTFELINILSKMKKENITAGHSHDAIQKFETLLKTKNDMVLISKNYDIILKVIGSNTDWPRLLRKKSQQNTGSGFSMFNDFYSSIYNT